MRLSVFKTTAVQTLGYVYKHQVGDSITVKLLIVGDWSRRQKLLLLVFVRVVIFFIQELVKVLNRGDDDFSLVDTVEFGIYATIGSPRTMQFSRFYKFPCFSKERK